MRWTLSALPAAALLLGFVVAPAQAHDAAVQSENAMPQFTGEGVVHETMRRHELFPYVYEEQTLVLMDGSRQRDVRRIHSYSRLEDDGTIRALLEFSYPESVAGTSLLFVRNPDETHSSHIFLPALGVMTDYVGGMAGGQLLGSEFSMDDLMPEDTAAFVYRREADVVDDEVPYFVVLASTRPERQAAYDARRLFIRQDNFFITRIDYLDAAGRLLKRQTSHDFRRIGGEMWSADMISVENMLNRHRSILKIDRRIYSRDYVPLTIFSEARILAAASPPAAELEAGSATDVDEPAGPAGYPAGGKRP